MACALPLISRLGITTHHVDLVMPPAWRRQQSLLHVQGQSGPAAGESGFPPHACSRHLQLSRFPARRPSRGPMAAHLSNRQRSMAAANGRGRDGSSPTRSTGTRSGPVSWEPCACLKILSYDKTAGRSVGGVLVTVAVLVGGLSARFARNRSVRLRLGVVAASNFATKAYPDEDWDLDLNAEYRGWTI